MKTSPAISIRRARILIGETKGVIRNALSALRENKINEAEEYASKAIAYLEEASWLIAQLEEEVRRWKT